MLHDTPTLMYVRAQIQTYMALPLCPARWHGPTAISILAYKRTKYRKCQCNFDRICCLNGILILWLLLIYVFDPLTAVHLCAWFFDCCSSMYLILWLHFDCRCEWKYRAHYGDYPLIWLECVWINGTAKCLSSIDHKVWTKTFRNWSVKELRCN